MSTRIRIDVATIAHVVFSSTMGAPHRRTIYTASLEAHVDRLHDQLASYAWAPVPPQKLEQYRGLNAKTAKVSDGH